MEKEILEIKEAGMQFQKQYYFLENKRKKALKLLSEISEKMKKLDYRLNREEYDDLVKQCHEAIRIHDTVLWELN